MMTRVLNNRTQILGLTSLDLFSLAVFYSSLQVLLFPFEVEFLSLILTFVLLVFLIPIRLQFRRGIIRDFFYFLFILAFFGGFYNVSRL